MDTDETPEHQVSLPETSPDQLQNFITLKDELLGKVAQKLRTTIGLLQGRINALARKASINDAELGEIEDHMNQLRDITAQLSDIIHLQSPSGQRERTPANVGDILSQYLAFYETKAHQKDIELTINLPDHELVYPLDANLFKATLSNLLSTVLDQCLNNTVLQLRLKEDESHFHITASYKSNVESSAQDLPIPQSLLKKQVELHEGTLRITSLQGPKKEIKLTFPLSPAQPSCQVSGKSKDHIPSHEHSGHALTSFSPHKNARAKILIVEDNPDMRDYVAKLLSDENYEVAKASDGIEALKELSIAKPDLIMSDIIMPNMNGFEFVEKLRNKSRYQMTPVILVSAKTEEESRIYGYQIGISDYLEKPFSELELKAMVQNLLHQQHERQQFLASNQQTDLSYEESLIKDLKQHVEKRIQDDNITIKELSDSINLSRRQLYRDLKTYTGFTPAEFVREVKLRKARQLLKQRRKMTVAEIARTVGYNTAAYFSKIFNRRFGRSPSEYR